MTDLRAQEIRIGRELFGLGWVPYPDLATPSYSASLLSAEILAEKLRELGWLVILKWIPEGHPFLGAIDEDRRMFAAAACELFWMGRAKGAGERHLIWTRPWAFGDTMAEALVKAAVLALDAMQKAGIPVTRPEEAAETVNDDG